MLNIISTLLVLIYSNFVMFTILKINKLITNFKEYVKFDGYSFLYINLVMVLITILLATIQNNLN